jgi:hypothetical protein
MKSRYAISRRDLNRSLVDRCQRSGQGRGSAYRGFREHRTLADWSRDPRYPDGCSEPFIPRTRGNDRSLRERSRWEVVQWNRDTRFPDGSKDSGAHGRQVASDIGISRVSWTRCPCTTKSRTPKADIINLTLKPSIKRIN